MGRAVCAAIAIAVMANPAWIEAQEQPKVVQPDDAQWKPLSPKQTVGGPLIQVLWGDPLKREGGFLLKLSAEGELPRRTHSSAYTVVVVSGTWMHAVQGEDYVEVLPGGHYTQRARERHSDKCVAGPDCVVVIRTAGKFDLKPVKVDTSGEAQPQVPSQKGR